MQCLGNESVSVAAPLSRQHTLWTAEEGSRASCQLASHCSAARSTPSVPALRSRVYSSLLAPLPPLQATQRVRAGRPPFLGGPAPIDGAAPRPPSFSQWQGGPPVGLASGPGGPPFRGSSFSGRSGSMPDRLGPQDDAYGRRAHDAGGGPYGRPGGQGAAAGPRRSMDGGGAGDSGFGHRDGGREGRDPHRDRHGDTWERDGSGAAAAGAPQRRRLLSSVVVSDGAQREADLGGNGHRHQVCTYMMTCVPHAYACLPCIPLLLHVGVCYTHVRQRGHAWAPEAVPQQAHHQS